MLEVRLVREPDRNGRKRVKIMIGSKALPTGFLDEFPEPIQRAFECTEEPYLVCETDKESPAPSDLRPRVLAVPEEKPRLGGNFDLNPYNFAEWAGTAPWMAERPTEGAHCCWHPNRLSGVIHLKLAAKRPIFVPAGGLPQPKTTFWKCRDVDGKERCAIPGSSLKGVVRTLFETWTNSRLSIVSSPGNPETKPDKGSYAAIPYRRRPELGPGGGGRLIGWVVSAVKSTGVTLQRANVVFATRIGPGRFAPTRNPGQVIKAEEVTSIQAGAHFNATPQALPLRMNLFWTRDHREHQSTHVILSLMNEAATIPADQLDRYRQLLRHRAFGEHPKRVREVTAAGLGTDYYQNIGVEERGWDLRREDMGNLQVGQLVFGMKGNASSLACFGRNVHFLWPSEKSPRDLVGKFWPRDDETKLDNETDTAEATFGFAGAYSKNAHPFRSRVRFSTFWLEGKPGYDPEVRLAALTSPTGVKLKARPLYLPPHRQTGKAQSYDEAKKLRGRKFYWHQWTDNNRVAREHLATNGGDQCPDPFQPLSAGSVFAGTVHFDNLSLVELGALLVSLVPNLFWDKEEHHDGFGYLLGKGKPRGLGSVHPMFDRLEIMRFEEGQDAYVDLDSPPLTKAAETVKSDALSAFRTWLKQQAQTVPCENMASADALPFVRDLEKLLFLKPEKATRNYFAADDPARLSEYGWMPHWGNVHGDPSGGPSERPRAMPKARFL